MNFKGLIIAVILLAGLAVIIFGAQKEDTPRTAIKAVIGQKAPELALTDASGNSYDLKRLKGKALFINFWAPWCRPCREEMPSIQALYNRFKDNPQFQMLTILYKEDLAKAEAYMKENNFKLPVMLDSSGTTAEAFGVTGIPETYIVDKKGVIRDRHIGPEDWNSPQVVALISALLLE